MEIHYQYLKLRKEFGRHPQFIDEGAVTLADFRPNEDHFQEYLDRSPITTVTNCVPDLSEHDANTTAVVYTNKGMNHVEGGWPKDVDYTEAEHVIRYHKKTEKDEEYIQTVCQLTNVVETVIKQNNAVDIYEDLFQDVCDEYVSEVPSTKTLTTLKDPSPIPRGVTYLNFHPDGSRRLAVAYSIVDFQRTPQSMPIHSYIWDIGNPNQPEMELEPISQLLCLKFNLKDNNLLGGGMYNGQFGFFDIRKGSALVEVTPIEVCHRDPVYDFAWLQCKTGTEALTVSTDGNAFWWDIRKLQEPLEQLSLKEKNSEVLLGGVSLEYDPAAGLTKFMIGTEQGSVLNCNRKAKNPGDRVGSVFQGHHAPVYGLRRNPYFPKYFLSLGDWTARVWNEDLKTPLVHTSYTHTTIHGGCWSPTRPAVFYAIKADGNLDIWDLCYKSTTPSLSVNVKSTSLTSFAIHESGGLCAVGSAEGHTTLLELSSTFVQSSTNEKQALAALLERETLREKNLEKANREMKIRARKEANKKDDVIAEDTDDDSELRLVEQHFTSDSETVMND